MRRGPRKNLRRLSDLELPPVPDLGVGEDGGGAGGWRRWGLIEVACVWWKAGIWTLMCACLVGVQRANLPIRTNFCEYHGKESRDSMVRVEIVH